MLLFINSASKIPMIKKINRTDGLAEPSDVIWLQTSFIGDIILSTAAMSALRACLPAVRQHLITTAIGAEALKHHHLLDSVHIYSKRAPKSTEGKSTKITTTPASGLAAMLSLRTKIRAMNLKNPVILQPHKSLRSTLLAKVIGYPVITYRETSGSLFAAKKIPRVAVLHESDRVSLLLEGLGIDRIRVLGFRPSLPAGLLPEVAQDLSKPLRWIAIAPGSVWATKRWPAEKYAALAQSLLEQKNTGLVLLGSKEESTAGEVILARLSCLDKRFDVENRLLNLVGRTSLADLNGIYPRLQMLISNDSSAIHYASAFNIPTLAIFGATVPAMGFSPLADGSQVAGVTLSCRPCSAHGPMVCPLGHFKCMMDLSVESVLAKQSSM
jgi:heptosyltransferase II